MGFVEVITSTHKGVIRGVFLTNHLVTTKPKQLTHINIIIAEYNNAKRNTNKRRYTMNTRKKILL